jgi:hypothetical protein
VCEIAHDPAIRLVKRDVGKRTEFVPMLSTCPTRGTGSCVQMGRPDVALSQRVLKNVIPACSNF